MHNTNIGGQAAGNPNHRHVVAFRDLRHPHRYLAVNGLAVDATFAGNY